MKTSWIWLLKAFALFTVLYSFYDIYKDYENFTNKLQQRVKELEEENELLYNQLY